MEISEIKNKTLDIVESLDSEVAVDCGSSKVKKGTILVFKDKNVEGVVIYNEKEEDWTVYLGGEFITCEDNFIDLFAHEKLKGYTFKLVQ